MIALFLLVAGALSVTIGNSPYDSDVAIERYPFAPERPAELNNTTAASYVTEHEEMLLFNGIIRSRGFNIDRGDNVRANCAVTSTEERTEDTFAVQLRCHGRMDDIYRIIQPTEFTYTARYAMNNSGVEILSLEGYPLGERGSLRERPPSAQ